MKKKMSEIKEISNSEAQRLAAYLHLPDKDKDRMFRLSEKKWEGMKMSENAENKLDVYDETAGYEKVSVAAVPVWKGAFRAAAAVAVIAAVGGAGAFMHMSVPKGASQYSSQSIQIETKDMAITNNSTKEVSEALSDKNESKDVVSVTESSKAAAKYKIVSSKSESQKEQSVLSSVSRQGAPWKEPVGDNSETVSEENDPKYVIKSFEITDSQPAEGECSVGEEQEEQARQDRGEETPQSLPAGVTSEEHLRQVTDGMTSEERLRMVTDGMTVREAIGVLGVPNFFYSLGDPLDEHSENDIAYYTMVDNNTLLFIEYDTLDDKALSVQREVNLIYDGNDDNNPWFFVTQPLSEMKSDPENRTFDCVVIDFDRENNNVKIVCPQYPMFDRAVCKLTDEQTETLVNNGCGKLSLLRITHGDGIEESYPAGIYAEAVDIFK